MIEADWWPGKLKILFLQREATFEKGQPFAQAISLPRKECDIKRMQPDEEKQREEARGFIEANESKFTTREVGVDGYAQQSNVYDRLSQLKKSGKLPEEVQAKKEPKPRLFWR